MDEKSFINEVRGFLFYSRVVWPIHRKLAGSLITGRCKVCIISANHSKLDDKGLCETCAKPTGTDSSAKPIVSQPLVNEVHSRIDSFSGLGKRGFDALILFSGGKDSAYLVHRIHEEHPRLRLLLFTVDNTFMSPLAMKNVQSLVNKLDLPHITIRPPAELYNKMFRHAFLNLNEKGCSGTVDQFDGDFFHDIARNWAAQNQIPLVLSGCSQTQVTRILGLQNYEFSRQFEESCRETVAGIRLREVFTPDEMKYWMNETGQENTSRPHLFFPFYAWSLDETEILAKVSEWNLLPPSAKNPLLTNSQLVPTMAMVDMVKFGYSSFEPEFCQMVRQGKADPHFWRNVFELSEYAAKTGRFVSQSVDQCLRRLQLSRRQLGIPE